MAEQRAISAASVLIKIGGEVIGWATGFRVTENNNLFPVDIMGQLRTARYEPVAKKFAGSFDYIHIGAEPLSRLRTGPNHLSVMMEDSDHAVINWTPLSMTLEDVNTAGEVQGVIEVYGWVPESRTWQISYGNVLTSNCFGYDTEVITANGIKPIGSLAGTTQRVLTSGGRWVEAPFRSFGEQQLYKLTLQRQGVEKVIYTTADHRWFAKDRRSTYRHLSYGEFKTTELRPEVHKLEYSFSHGVKHCAKPSPFGVAHGFTFGDGSTVRDGKTAQRVAVVGEKFHALAPYFSQCVAHPRPDINAMEYSGLPDFFRAKPSLLENTAYLYGWLAGYFAADGSVTNGQVTLSSVKKENIEFVRELCAVIGIGTYSLRDQTVVSNLTGRDHTMYALSLMRDTIPADFFLLPHHKESFLDNGGQDIPPRNWTVKQVEALDRREEVFCATVPAYGCFTLGDNILTGNCAFVCTDVRELPVQHSYTPGL